jgi:hypothetical protein
MRAGNGASAVNQVESVTGLHVLSDVHRSPRRVGCRNLPAGMRLFLRVLTGERWAENEELSTVRIWII